MRAATRLADLCRSQSRPAEGEAALRPIYDWFTEGFDYLDLRRAREALDACHSNATS